MCVHVLLNICGFERSETLFPTVHLCVQITSAKIREGLWKGQENQKCSGTIGVWGCV